MAMLDAILCPEWSFRYYSFNSFWDADEQLGSMRDGSGDHFFAHFSAAGCWVKGFAHESPMSPYRKNPPCPWPGILEVVPTEFEACLREPAFSVGDVTFCIWRRYGDRGWQRGPVDYPLDQSDPDGSESLLSPLDGQPETYRAWAECYYEREVALEMVQHIFGHRRLTAKVVNRVNPDVDLAGLESEIREIGYPQS
jgi:hypothetical protein